jgi:hypothetical protein
MSSSHDEPMIDIARGDRALSRQLRTALETLRDRSDNREFRGLVGDVLAGRRGLREIARTPAFDSMVTPLAREFGRRFDEMSEAEREQLARQGKEAYERLRQQVRESPRGPQNR